MRWAWVGVLAAVGCGAAVPAARGQDLVFQQPQVLDPGTAAVADRLILGPPPVRVISGDGLAPAPAPTDRPAGVKGVVGGVGLNNRTDASVGFLYLVPLWSFRDFQLAAPRGSEG